MRVSSDSWKKIFTCAALLPCLCVHLRSVWRASTAEEQTPWWPRCSAAVSSGQPSALQKLRTAAPGRVRLPSPVSVYPSAIPCAHRDWTFGTSKFKVWVRLGFKKKKKKKEKVSKWTNVLRSCAPESPSHGTSCGTATFCRVLSSDTSVCATVCVWKVCVQRVFERSRFTAAQISRYSHVASAPPPPVVRWFRERKGERERESEAVLSLFLSLSQAEKTDIWSPPQSQDETYCNDKAVSTTSPRTVFKETKSSENVDKQIPERVAQSQPRTQLEACCWRLEPLQALSPHSRGAEVQRRVRNADLGQHWLTFLGGNLMLSTRNQRQSSENDEWALFFFFSNNWGMLAADPAAERLQMWKEGQSF